MFHRGANSRRGRGSPNSRGRGQGRSHHPAGHRELCRYGLGCTKYGCTYAHPSGRPKECSFGADCRNGPANPCRFLHPMTAGSASSRALTLLPRGGGGGAVAHRRGEQGSHDHSRSRAVSTMQQQHGRGVQQSSTTTDSFQHTRHLRPDGTVVVTQTRVQQTEVVVTRPYGRHAGRNVFDSSVPRDRFGNVRGPEYDLSPDNAFRGQSIAILQFYTAGFGFKDGLAALGRKGFEVIRWTSMPDLEAFKRALFKVSQLWVISSDSGSSWTPGHLELVQKMVDARKGLFIWADNDPFTRDANVLLKHLSQTNELSMGGNYHGAKALTVAPAHDQVGFTARHLVTTGIESLYEGITIASVRGPVQQHRSLIRSSDGNVVTACHDKHKVRILIDGGFTRLMDECWDKTAGTARFVTNAACWLYNWEGRQKPRAIAAAKKSGGRSG